MMLRHCCNVIEYEKVVFEKIVMDDSSKWGHQMGT